MSHHVANDEVWEENNEHQGGRRTISSCERELEDIHGLLKGMSTDIHKRMSERIVNKPPKIERKRELSSAESLNEFLSASNSEFEVETNRMSSTDLDMLQYALEGEMKTLQGQLEQAIDEDEDRAASLEDKISLCQDRIYRCVTKRGQLVTDRYYSDFVKRHSKQYLEDSDDENDENANVAASPPPPKPRFEFRDSVNIDEIRDMNLSQLQTLLRHYSISYPETSNRGDLLNLVEEKILKSGLEDSWSPPPSSTLTWNEVKQMNEGTVPSINIFNYEGPTTPVEKSFSLKPGDLQDYLKYKAVSDNKLVDWDPTKLLHCLYGKITEGSRKLRKQDTKTDRKANSMHGFLDKLPMNQSRVRAFRGWKRRYFKIQRGKLFYYENGKSGFPLGSIDLVGSEVSSGDGLTINIVARLKFDINKDLQGNRLVLKCNTKEEHEDWLAALQNICNITPLPETFTKQDKNSIKKKNDIVIIDFGASTVRAGLASDSTPVVAFPSAFAVQQNVQKNRRFTNSGIPDPHSCKCGFEAFYPENRKGSKIVYPLRPTRNIDQYSIKVRYLPGLLEKVFHDLAIDSNGTVVVISCPRYITLRNKEFLLDYLFGQMGVDGVYIQQQSILALYSHNVTTGLIVDLGDHADVFPIIEGNMVESGSTSLPYAGQQITEYFSKLLTETGYRFFSDIESYLVRYLKEEVAQTSVDFLDDMTSSPDPVIVDVSQFNIPMDKSEVKIGDTKFRCVEGLFNPGLWGKDVMPLHHMLMKSVKATNIDQRRTICKNIYLTGGTSMITGLAERLERELKSSFPENVQVKVTAAPHRLNAAYKGAIVIAGLSNFKDLVINRKEWETADREILLSRWQI